MYRKANQKIPPVKITQGSYAYCYLHCLDTLLLPSTTCYSQTK